MNDRQRGEDELIIKWDDRLHMPCPECGCEFVHLGEHQVANYDNPSKIRCNCEDGHCWYICLSADHGHLIVQLERLPDEDHPMYEELAIVRAAQVAGEPPF